MKDWQFSQLMMMCWLIVLLVSNNPITYVIALILMIVYGVATATQLGIFK